MAENRPTAQQDADRERFTSFLEEIASRPSQFKDWELRLLGGFGGYQSQVPASPIKPPPAKPVDQK